MFLLASDFDRTFYINNYDFKRNLKLLDDYMKTNVFVIATGRSYDDYMNVTKDCIPLNYLVVNHGATIIKDDKVIKSCYIKEKTIEKLKKIFNFNKIEYFACHDTDSRVDINTKNLSKINITLPDNLIAKKAICYINEHFDDVKAYLLFHKNQFEIVPIEANKKNAISYISKLENIDKGCVYTIGDGYTDFEMLKYFNGYCMKDSVSELKTIAHTVDSVGNLIDYLSVSINMEEVSDNLINFIDNCFDYTNYFKKYVAKIYCNNKEKNHLVIRKNNNIIAVALLNANKIYFNNESLNCLCVGSICVNKNYRKKGYLKMLMGIIEQKAKKYDFKVLSGDYKRYEKYGYYPNILNLYHVNAKNNNIEFRNIKKDTDNILKMYQNSNIHAIRTKDEIINICTQWQSCAYSIYKNNEFTGYLIYNPKKNYVSEIFDNDIISSLESFAFYKQREYINVSILNNDYINKNKFKNFAFVKSYNRQLYSINNIKRVLEVCLNYKSLYIPLQKGSLAIKIDNEIIRITSLNSVIIENSDTYDISINRKDLMNILLNKKIHNNKLLSSWFYLNLDIYNNDLV